MWIGDLRVNNGGKHVREHNFTAADKALWILRVQEYELIGANNPVALALKDEGIEANAQDRYGRKYRNEQYDLFMSNIPKWRQEPTYSRIMQEYTSGLKIPNYTPSYPKMEAKLAMEIRSKRKRKRRVSPRWIRSRALEILKEDPSAREGGRDSNAVDRWQEFTASRTWARKFMTRNRFSIRKKTNSKKYSVVERMPLLASWTRRFRAKLNEGPPQCDVYRPRLLRS
eukprot:COSAG05_NODE_7688_length_778_cov_1.451471_1_plen_226_part_10